MEEYNTTYNPTQPSLAPHRFVRRGVVGSHKDEMTAEVIREFDLWSDINLRDYKLHSDDFATYSKYEERSI